MPETFEEKINRILRDHEGYDGNGGTGALPVGDRSTARKPISKRDLREAMRSFADVEGNAGDALTARDEAVEAARTADEDATQTASDRDYVETRAAQLEGISVSGVTRKESVACATTANLTLSGEQTIDGVTTSASRVLVKSQTAPAQNGIYVSAPGAWSRASDMDAAGEVQGAAVYVTGGTAGAGKTFYTGSAVTTLGTDAIAWVVSEDQGALSGAVNDLDNYTKRITDNLFKSGDFVLGRPDIWAEVIESGTKSIVVDLNGGQELRALGFTRAMQQRQASDFVVHDPGSDVNGLYVFGAFFLSATTPSDKPLYATILGMDAGDALTVPAVQTNGYIDISDDVRFCWSYVRVSDPTVKLLLGNSSTPSSATSRHMSGMYLATSTAEMEPEQMIRAAYADAKVKVSSAPLDQVGSLAKRDVVNRFNESLVREGGFQLIAPSSGTEVAVVDPHLLALGFRKAILWGSTNSFAYVETPDNIFGKYLFGGFWAQHSDTGGKLDYATLYTRTTGGAIAQIAVSSAAGLTRGVDDISDTLQIAWATGICDTGDFPQIAVGRETKPAVGTRHATGYFLFVSDEPFDGERRSMLLRQIKSTAAARVSTVEIAESIEATTGATLFLAGTGNGESYVESDHSGTKIKRTFVAFPDVSVDSHPNTFNFRKDVVNGVTVREVQDDVAPYRFDGATIGANHGYFMHRVTATAHGKVQADQGSIWQVGGTNYLLIEVESANSLLLAQQGVNSSVSPPTGSYAHVSGATNTANFTVSGTPALLQWYPPFTNYDLRLVVDGRVVDEMAGKTHYQDRAQFIETYEILSYAQMVAWWQANGASGADLTPTGSGAVRICTTYQFDADANCTIVSDFIALAPVTLNDIMFLQAQIGGIDEYYVPTALPFTYDGATVDYAMKESATLTAGKATLEFTPARCAVTGLYADRIVGFDNGGGAYFAMGFLPVGDAAIDVRRAQASAKGLTISPASKAYLFGVDKGDISLTAGDVFSVIGYRNILPTLAGRSCAYPVRTLGADYFFADWHDVSKVDLVPLPADYVGRDFTVVASKNAAVLNTTLAGGLSVDVSATGENAFIVLKIA